jgi:hypothetical protein
MDGQQVAAHFRDYPFTKCDKRELASLLNFSLSDIGPLGNDIGIFLASGKLALNRSTFRLNRFSRARQS